MPPTTARYCARRPRLRDDFRSRALLDRERRGLDRRVIHRFTSHRRQKKNGIPCQAFFSFCLIILARTARVLLWHAMAARSSLSSFAVLLKEMCMGTEDHAHCWE